MTDIYLNIRKSLLVIHIYQVNLCPYRTQQQRKTGLSCLSRISQFYIFLFSSELSRHSFISKFDSLQDLRFTHTFIHPQQFLYFFSFLVLYMLLSFILGNICQCRDSQLLSFGYILRIDILWVIISLLRFSFLF